MTYELISERNLSQGFQVVFQYVNDVTTGLFIQLFLGAVWVIISMGIYFRQKEITGMGDFPMAITIAGFSTTVLAIIIRLIPGLIDSATLAIIIVVTSISALWFFLSRG